MCACNAPFASAISVDWSFDWRSAYRFFRFSGPAHQSSNDADEKKKRSAADWSLKCICSKRLRGHSKQWDKPPPTAGAERSVTRPLVACWRGRNGVLELWWVMGANRRKNEATGSKEERIWVFVILRCLFWGFCEITSLEICHICGALCL